MEFDVRKIAAQKQRDFGQDETTWKKVLESARLNIRFVDLSYEDITELAESSSSPDQFQVLIRLLYHYGRAHQTAKPMVKKLHHNVSSSNYPLSEWIAALEVFYLWVLKENYKLDLNAMLEYLGCCVQLPEAVRNQPPLKTLVEEALTTYGLDW